MERIVYRKTLDVHKNGVQFTLQGFETADKMARTLEISLMASGDTIDFPLEQVTAMIYVTTPNASEPSINECTIKDNKVIYDVLPIVEEGITEMQVKLIGTRVGGAKGVLAMPKFAIEVLNSNVDDDGVMQTTTYTALENAIAKANGVYDARLLRIELDSECMFRAYYADGTTYETDILKELFHKGEALLSQSYARGGTGVRAGEDTDNSMYYSNVSKSASQDAESMRDDAVEVLEEVRKHGVYTAFSVDFEKGEVEYVSPSYTFIIDKDSGELKAIGETYTFEETIQKVVNDWLINNGADIEAMQQSILENGNAIANLQTLTSGHTQSIDANTQAIQKLEETSATHTEDIEGLKETSSSNASEIETLKETTSANSKDILDLKADVSAQDDAISLLDAKSTANKFPLYVCETGATGPIARGTLNCNRQGNVYWLSGTIKNVTPKTSGADTETRTFWLSDDGVSPSEAFNRLPSFKHRILVSRHSSYDENSEGFFDDLIVDVEGNQFVIIWQTPDVMSYDLYFDMMFIIDEPQMDG